MAFVIEAIQTTVSAVIGAPVARFRLPKAPSKMTPSAVRRRGSYSGNVARFRGPPEPVCNLARVDHD